MIGWRLATRTAAIDRLPHAPQLEETNEWRSSLAASGRRRAEALPPPRSTRLA